MKLLDRYVFCEWLKIFLVAICVTLGILVLHDMYSNLGKLINWGADTKQILLFYGLLSPTLVPVVLPISLLLSLIYVLGSLHRNNEITAMRAAGMNVFKITRSLWFAGVLLSGLLLWLNAHIIPVCKESSRELYDSIRFAEQMQTVDLSEVGRVNALCFNNRKDGRLWFMNSFSQATNRARGATVSTLDPKGGELSRIMAREGVYDDVDRCWYFLDGQEIDFDPKTHRAVKAVGFDKRYFKEFDEDPKIMVLSMRRPKDLSLFETKTLIESMGSAEAPEAIPYLVRAYSIWFSPFACIIVVAIAIPFSVAGVRTNPMVGVSKTVGLFFVYFILDSVFTAVGGRGIISPLWAAAIPNIAMLIFALTLYRKVV